MCHFDLKESAAQVGTPKGVSSLNVFLATDHRH